jgi:hypothetical protein
MASLWNNFLFKLGAGSIAGPATAMMELGPTEVNTKSIHRNSVPKHGRKELLERTRQGLNYNAVESRSWALAAPMDIHKSIDTKPWTSLSGDNT